MEPIISIIQDFIWLIIPLFILQLALFISALVSILRKNVTGTEKLPWLLLAFFLNTIGPIIYFVIGSKQLDEKIARREDEQWQQR